MSLTPRSALGALLYAALGCGTSEPPEPPQSRAVKVEGPAAIPQPQRVVVPNEPGQVVDPVHPPELRTVLPALKGMTEQEQQTVAAALNLVPGPCAPCKKAEEHLARCALRGPSRACANVPGLLRRAVGTAKAGRPLREVMESVHYPDIWIPLPGQPDRVDVHLILEADSPWAKEGRSTQAALEAKYGDRIEITVHPLESKVAKALGVGTTPAWAVAGYRMRGAQSADALQRLLDREMRDRGTP